MRGDRLRGAFGLSDEVLEGSAWLVESYTAQSAAQGKYIRLGKFLNIPCAGTGHDGDPNVSIVINPDMRDAVDRLTR